MPAGTMLAARTSPPNLKSEEINNSLRSRFVSRQEPASGAPAVEYDSRLDTATHADTAGSDSTDDSVEHSYHNAYQARAKHISITPLNQLLPSKSSQMARRAPARPSSTVPSQLNSSDSLSAARPSTSSQSDPPSGTEHSIIDFDPNPRNSKRDSIRTLNFDLDAPPPKSPGRTLEGLSERLFSADHLHSILRDSGHAARFAAFLDKYKPAVAPHLSRYLQMQKAMKAIEWANALAGSLVNAPGTDASAQIPCDAALLDSRFELRAQRALKVVVDEGLPAYVTMALVELVTDTMVRGIKGSSPSLIDGLVGGLSEVFCLTDPKAKDNPIIYASEEFYRQTGYGRDFVIGRNCRFLQGPMSSPYTVARLAEAIHEGRESMETLLNYRRDGTPFLNLLLCAPLYDHRGTVRYFVGAQVDVSGLVEDSRGLDSFANLLAEDRRLSALSKLGGSEAAEQARGRSMTLLGEMVGMLSKEEAMEVQAKTKPAPAPRDNSTDTTRRWLEQDVRNVRSSGNHHDRSGASSPALGRSAMTRALTSRLPGLYQNYLIVRPTPPYNIVFVSPALRIPGLLQSPLLSRIGGPNQIRDGIAHAFRAGLPVTAKVRWLAAPKAHNRQATSNWESSSLGPGDESRAGSVNGFNDSQAGVNGEGEAGYDSQENAGRKSTSDTLTSRGSVSTNLRDKEGKARTKWLSCTPLLGSDDRVGVWMIVVIEEDKTESHSASSSVTASAMHSVKTSDVTSVTDITSNSGSPIYQFPSKAAGAEELSTTSTTYRADLPRVSESPTVSRKVPILRQHGSIDSAMFLTASVVGNSSPELMNHHSNDSATSLAQGHPSTTLQSKYWNESEKPKKKIELVDSPAMNQPARRLDKVSVEMLDRELPSLPDVAEHSDHTPSIAHSLADHRSALLSRVTQVRDIPLAKAPSIREIRKREHRDREIRKLSLSHSQPQAAALQKRNSTTSSYHTTSSQLRRHSSTQSYTTTRTRTPPPVAVLETHTAATEPPLQCGPHSSHSPPSLALLRDAASRLDAARSTSSGVVRPVVQKKSLNEMREIARMRAAAAQAPLSSSPLQEKKYPGRTESTIGRLLEAAAGDSNSLLRTKKSASSVPNSVIVVTPPVSKIPSARPGTSGSSGSGSTGRIGGSITRPAVREPTRGKSTSPKRLPARTTPSPKGGTVNYALSSRPGTSSSSGSTALRQHAIGSVLLPKNSTISSSSPNSGYQKMSTTPDNYSSHRKQGSTITTDDYSGLRKQGSSTDDYSSPELVTVRKITGSSKIGVRTGITSIPTGHIAEQDSTRSIIYRRPSYANMPRPSTASSTGSGAWPASGLPVLRSKSSTLAGSPATPSRVISRTDPAGEMDLDVDIGLPDMMVARLQSPLGHDSFGL